MRSATIVGARPQFIKAAPLSHALAEAGVGDVLIHTGQHYDHNMSAVFFDELEIPPPRHNLGIGSGPHGRQTGRMIEAIEAVLLAERPDVVVVYGDTNSTLAAALAATKLHIPLAHVEAGLRSFNRRMPEEINRILTDCVADVLFTPTDAADANLVAEGVDPARIVQVGDIMYDAARIYGQRAREHSAVLSRLEVARGAYILATVHRAENTDDPARMNAIFDALLQTAEQHRIIMPLHPRTRAALGRHGRLSAVQSRLDLIDPVGYLDMIALESGAALIATDSGGVQKEAWFQRVPCVTLRDETEWTELVDAGWNHLVPPTSTEAVLRGIALGLSSGQGEPLGETFYGGGRAASRIVETLRHRFS